MRDWGDFATTKSGHIAAPYPEATTGASEATHAASGAILVHSHGMSPLHSTLPEHLVRKEKETLHLPKDLPTVVGLNAWLAKVAQALAEASAYNDRKEVAWFLQVSEPDQTFETLADPGLDRFHNLDSMLSVALQGKIKGGDLERELYNLLSNMIKEQRLISGRQVAHMVCHSLRLNEKRSTVYSITDVCNVKWAGDTYAKISLFKSHWDNVVQTLPSLFDDLLCEMLVTQMKQSKEFAMGVKD